MKVGLLIELLQKIDPDTDVAIYVYDEGNESYWSAKEVIVQQLVGTDCQGCTNYQEADYGRKAWEKEKPKTTVVTLHY